MITMAYMTAAVFFILSLGGLSSQETARRGNIYGVLGILIAILATIISPLVTSYHVLLTMMITGAGIGITLARRVEMTAMPQLVALLHSFVGLAAVLVGWASFLDARHQYHGIEAIIHDSELYIGIFIGAVTFTGSLVAFGKLQGFLKSKPLMLPARHWLNLAIIVASVFLCVYFIDNRELLSSAIAVLSIMTFLALFLGWHLVMAIGGADMPVVVSMLNSYSGWAAAATGFLLSNDLLIVTGALVGSSGAILSYIMCRAMNRSFLSVILGGFGVEGGTVVKGEGVEGEAKPIEATELAGDLKQSSQVIIIPGYGMAVAHAQQAVQELTAKLRDKNVHVRFAIHPVAGRLPGHMNVLLAEANVPYDIVLEMDEINKDFKDTDIAIVIGANDIVNPDAKRDPTSPIAGMPVLECWQAKKVVVLKRSLASGYAGVENPLFFLDNTNMLFGDAKDSVQAVISALD